MVDESLDSMDPESLEEDAEVEVNKVIEEITGETFAGVGTIKGKNTQQQEVKEEPVDQAEIDAMKARLSNLQS
jgi:thioredoxin reductase